MLRIPLLVVIGVSALAGCIGDGDDAGRTQLQNSDGKADSATMRVRLTAGSPTAELFVLCDQPQGCAGTIELKVLTPSACEILTGGTDCPVGTMSPVSRDVASMNLHSQAEGSRTLPLTISTDNGEYFTESNATAWSAVAGEEVTFVLTRASSAPDLYVQVKATWNESSDNGEERRALEAFLGSVPGLTFTETSTEYAGYRAYDLQYEQPIDHETPTAGTFRQAAQLLHKSTAAPMVLYTSGYGLDAGYLSELGETLGANQISTEQRWFGTSSPERTAESWKNVTIEQAAQDHHRLVEALRPYYTNKWVSTGHSKGGMTSVYHHRFFPTDVDATVAYVAPISFAAPDARYIPFLDQIGEATCRENVRAVQKKSLEKFDELFALSRAYVQPGDTFDREGGPEAAFEKAIVSLEWGWWQAYGITQCDYFATVPEDAQGLWDLIGQLVGAGSPDGISAVQAYEYQSEMQLGYQQFATAHLPLQYADAPSDRMPAGVTKNYDPAPMLDIDRWVKSDATKILFLYGEYDPWTGGAFDLGGNANLTRVTVPKATHAAMLRELPTDEKKIAYDRIEAWLGARPEPVTPRGAPHPALPRMR